MERVIFALGVLLATVVGESQLAALSAPSEESRLCLDRNSPPDAAIDDCSAIISSAKLRERDLASAYNQRAYFHLKKGEQSQALADALEAIRLGKDLQKRSFITENFGVIIPTVVAALTWALTYWGWTVVHCNSSKLEHEKYRNAIALEQRKAKLQRVDDQIQLLYGPLQTLVKTRRAAFDAMMRDYAGDRRHFFDGKKRTPEELRQWRLWREFVLMPIVEKMEKAILENSHLIDSEQMPKSFLDLLEHAASYKAVMKNWEFFQNSANDREVKVGDTGNVPTISIDAQRDENGEWDPVVPHTAHENFPEDALTRELETKILFLRRIQGELLATLQK
jgi:hypothetical protein